MSQDGVHVEDDSLPKLIEIGNSLVMVDKIVKISFAQDGRPMLIHLGVADPTGINPENGYTGLISIPVEPGVDELLLKEFRGPHWRVQTPEAVDLLVTSGRGEAVP